MYYDNLTLMTDLYELTMMQGYYFAETHEKEVVFDLFYRNNPDNNGYAIVAGLAQAIEYIENLEFSKEDLEYLKSLKIFKDEFLEYLKNFKFTCDVYAIPEGTVVFPQEPLVRVRGPIIEAQLIESALLNIINHQSLIATKAARVCWAAKGDNVLEFGLRRAQGPDAGIYGARAAMIGGCHSTSNVLSGKLFNVPVSGTHAHSWIMSFPDELTAFREYAKMYPDNCILLIDTYSTLNSGLPNAIKVFEELREEGKLNKYGIRLDSGDLAYLSKQVRKSLDEAGFEDGIISASSDLDEHLITSLKHQGATITTWGVGTNLITSKDSPAFGGVYKLVAETDQKGTLVPKIKLSDNPEKITNPGEKTVFRLYDRETNKVKADLISLVGETIDTTKDLTIFHPIMTWKQMTLKANEFYVKELLVPIFSKGECVYKSPDVMDIRAFCQNDLNTFWEEHRRLDNPQILPVDLSMPLYTLRSKMLQQLR